MGGEHTFVEIDAAAGVVEAMVRDLDVATLSGVAATRLVERLVVCERVVAAARARAAARAVDANQWRHAGQRDEAAFVAGLTGTTTGAAAAELATTRRLAGLDATRAARDAGALSDLAAREVASAATVDPGAEAALLDHATRDDAAALKRRCAAVRAAAERDEAAARERIRRARRFRSWTDEEGGWCFAGRGLPEDGAALLAAMRAHQDHAFAEHRRRGVHESTDAYAYDALMALARNDQTPPGHAGHVDDRPPGADAPGPSAGGRAGTTTTTSGCGNARQPDADAPRPSAPGPPVPDHLVARARAAHRGAATPGETTSSPRPTDASGLGQAHAPTPGDVVDRTPPPRDVACTPGGATTLVPAGLVARARAAQRGAATPAHDATGPPPDRSHAARPSSAGGRGASPHPLRGGGLFDQAPTVVPTDQAAEEPTLGHGDGQRGAGTPGEDGGPVTAHSATADLLDTDLPPDPLAPDPSPADPSPDPLAPDPSFTNDPATTDPSPDPLAPDPLAPDPLAADPPATDPLPGHVCPRPGPRTKVIVRIDHAALVRGHTEPGEVCEIAGVGPIPVATARDLARDAFLAAVVTNGRDVSTVAHLGRAATAHQRSALETRGMCCAVPGCGSLHRLEIDHVDGWALTRRTALDQLDWLCRFHHGLKTNQSYRLAGPPGARTWHPPGEAAPSDTR